MMIYSCKHSCFDVSEDKLFREYVMFVLFFWSLRYFILIFFFSYCGNLLDETHLNLIDMLCGWALQTFFFLFLLYHVMQMKIFVKTSRERIAPEVESSDTIDSIKGRIEEMDGLPGHLQRFYYAGRFLNDYCTFADYKIEEGREIWVIIRLLGGPWETAASDCSLGFFLQIAILPLKYSRDI